MTKDKGDKGTKAAPATTGTGLAISTLRQLLERAERGDPKAFTELRPLIDRRPELWEEFGDLAQHTEQALVRMAAGESLVTQEAYQRKLVKLRTEIAGPAPTPLERLLAERIALCWFQLSYAEAIAAQEAGKLTRDWAEYHQRRIDRAHRRYLAAIKTLATVRRLLTPAMQVNIAEQQVNISQ